MLPQLVLLSMLVFVPSQLPFEEYIVQHETGWELSTGDHDWFIKDVWFNSDLYTNQSSEIEVMVDLNGSIPYTTNGTGWTHFPDDYTLKTSIYFEAAEHSYMWYELGFLPSRHGMKRTPSSDCPVQYECFSYLLNWSYPDMKYAFEVDDEYGRTHWASAYTFFINVSSHEGWETLGWYRYPSFNVRFHTVQEWEVTKQPYQDIPYCGGVSYPPYPGEEYLTERNLFLVAIAAGFLWYSGDIYRFIKPKDVSKDAKEENHISPKESASENNSNPKTD